MLLVTIRRCEKIYLSALKWPRFGSNRGVGRISGNNANVKEMKRGGENDECALGKDYDTERRLFGGNGYRDLSYACTVEISIDSQLGWIPSVVSAPIPQPSPLNPTISSSFSLSFLLSLFGGSKSFLLLFTDILAEMVSCIDALSRRILFPISPLSSPFTFSTFTPCFLSVFRRQFDSARERESRIAPKLAWWIANKWIHFVKFQFLYACPRNRVPYSNYTAYSHRGLLTDMIITYVCFA